MATLAATAATTACDPDGLIPGAPKMCTRERGEQKRRTAAVVLLGARRVAPAPEPPRHAPLPVALPLARPDGRPARGRSRRRPRRAPTPSAAQRGGTGGRREPLLQRRVRRRSRRALGEGPRVRAAPAALHVLHPLDRRVR